MSAPLLSPERGRWILPEPSPRKSTEKRIIEKRTIENVDLPDLQEHLKRSSLGVLEPLIYVNPPDPDMIKAFESTYLIPVPQERPQLVPSNHGAGNVVNKFDKGQTLPPLLTSLQSEDSAYGTGIAPITRKEICFGMIPDAAVEISEEIVFLQALLADAVCTPDLYHFKVVTENGLFFIKLLSGKIVGVFDEATSRIFQSLASFPSCRYEAYADSESWQEIDLKKPKKEPPMVDIVLYGVASICESVGKQLSSKCTYLQHPVFRLPDTEYDNPHFLKLAGLTVTDSTHTSFSRSTSSGIEEDATKTLVNNSDFDLNPQAQMRRKIAAVMGSLTRSTNLKCLEADIRIKTPLLKHQMEALDFMSQREFGPIPEKYSLWTKRCQHNREFFEHQIVGLKKSFPSIEIGGGILADDMGLGKTLTVISTIIRTAQKAQAFAMESKNAACSDSCPKGDMEKRNSRSTLVIVPSTLLLDGWIEQINEHCDGSLGLEIYHGRNRQSLAASLAESDLVLSTYHTVAAESLDDQSPLYQINWFRIVLDEAHIIRRMTTKLYKAVSKLSARLRWCLTGTPVQNSLEDIASLISFIRSPLLDNLQDFRKHIINPLLNGTSSGSENLRILLDSVCLRRTKKLLDLPDMDDEYRPVEFSSAERAHYHAAELEMVKEIKQFDTQARNTKGYFGIFQLQLQLRRLCNHGTFHKAFSRAVIQSGQFDPEEALALLKDKKDAKCTYCSKEITGLRDIEETCTGSFTVCGHLLCTACVARYRRSLRSSETGACLQCSLCLRRISTDYIMSLTTSDEIVTRTGKSHTTHYFEREGISSKVSQLVFDLQNSSNEGKSIVFSCWTKSLDLIEMSLGSHQIRSVRIDGSHTALHRQKVLEEFEKDPNVRILLMTTGTGAIGLNLTIADCVYILEPQWNPMIEAQAIARVLRLGQKRNVKVVRYIIKGTVEEGMRTQQIRKLEFAKLGWKESVRRN